VTLEFGQLDCAVRGAYSACSRSFIWRWRWCLAIAVARGCHAVLFFNLWRKNAGHVQISVLLRSSIPQRICISCATTLALARARARGRLGAGRHAMRHSRRRGGSALEMWGLSTASIHAFACKGKCAYSYKFLV
jgi:hypothetical protein